MLLCRDHNIVLFDFDATIYSILFAKEPKIEVLRSDSILMLMMVLVPLENVSMRSQFAKLK